jgi:hypothetical protein
MAQTPDDGRPGVLNPVDRFSEVIFGLLMVLSIAGSVSVATVGQGDVRTLLIAAIGCNTAWGRGTKGSPFPLDAGRLAE